MIKSFVKTISRAIKECFTNFEMSSRQELAREKLRILASKWAGSYGGVMNQLSGVYSGIFDVYKLSGSSKDWNDYLALRQEQAVVSRQEQAGKE